MSRRLRLLVIVFAFAGSALVPLRVAATYGVDEFRMELWMLPAVDGWDYNACLTQRWHGAYYDPNHALDWKATCGASGSETVRFRAVSADLDRPFGSWWYGARAYPANLPSTNCGLGVVHVSRVTIWSAVLVVARGSMYYVHAVMDTTAAFNLKFEKGTTRTSGWIISRDVAHTVSDQPAGSSCWTGWHLHENNSNDAVKYWNSWNSKWTTASLCDCYLNTDRNNWIRRLAWVDEP